MGFFDTLGKIVKGAGEIVMENAKELSELKNLYSNYSNEKLERKVKYGSSKEKIAAHSILKERGYSEEALKKLLLKNS